MALPPVEASSPDEADSGVLKSSSTKIMLLGFQGCSPRAPVVTQKVLATVGLRGTQGRVFVGLFSSEIPKVGFCRGEDAHEGILMLK